MRPFWILFGVLAVSSQASAESPSLVRVGSIEAEETCEYFREYEGRSNLTVSPYFITASREFRSWIVKDCYSDFMTLRSSLEAALASTGKLQLSDRGYTVDVTLGEVSLGGAAPPVRPAADGDYSVSRSYSTVALSITVRDPAGRSVYGSNFVKKLETGLEMSVSGEWSRRRLSPEAAYGALQNEVAKSIARAVSFHLSPMQVTRVSGTRVELNYGSPILEIGSTVYVDGERGLSRMKYLVTSTAQGSAYADPDGDYPGESVRPGALATFAEADSAAAGGRRYRRVPLR